MNNALPGQSLTATFINVQSSVVNLVTCQLQLHDFDWKGSICKSISFLSTLLFSIFTSSCCCYSHMVSLFGTLIATTVVHGSALFVSFDEWFLVHTFLFANLTFLIYYQLIHNRQYFHFSEKILNATYLQAKSALRSKGVPALRAPLSVTLPTTSTRLCFLTPIDLNHSHNYIPCFFSFPSDFSFVNSSFLIR